MKNNSKSGLKISEIIATLSAFFIIATSTQLFITNQDNEQTESETEIQEVNIEEKEVDRKIATTSRSGNHRGSTKQTTENINASENIEETKKYKSIEEIRISKNMDLTITTGISKEDFKKLMKNLKCDTSGFFYKNSDTIYDLCQKYELNEIFFCGLIAGESGWNISANHRNKCNYISMMSSKGLIKYSSDEEGLEAATKLLHNKYLTKGGSCYSGKTLSAIQKRFCPNSNTWVGLVFGCMKQVVK